MNTEENKTSYREASAAQDTSDSVPLSQEDQTSSPNDQTTQKYEPNLIVEKASWRHTLPAFAPLIAFLGFLAVVRFNRTPSVPPISLLPPALVVLGISFFISDWLTSRFRAQTQYAPHTVWSRQTLRNNLVSNLLFTFVRQGSFSLPDLLIGMLLNWVGSIVEEHVGRTATTTIQQLLGAVKWLAIFLALRFLIPSSLSLDSTVGFFFGVYVRASFNAFQDLLIDNVSRPFPNQRWRFQALGLLVSDAVILMFMLAPTPFFQTSVGDRCPNRWKSLMFNYACLSSISLNEPRALWKQLACSRGGAFNTTLVDAQEKLNASAAAIYSTCGFEAWEYAQLRSCQSLLLVEKYANQSPTNATPYLSTAERCARLTGSAKLARGFHDNLELLKVLESFQGMSVKVTGINPGTESSIWAALPRELVHAYGKRNLRSAWTNRYL